MQSDRAEHVPSYRRIGEQTVGNSIVTGQTNAQEVQYLSVTIDLMGEVE